MPAAVIRKIVIESNQGGLSTFTLFGDDLDSIKKLGLIINGETRDITISGTAKEKEVHGTVAPSTRPRNVAAAAQEAAGAGTGQISFTIDITTGQGDPPRMTI